MKALVAKPHALAVALLLQFDRVDSWLSSRFEQGMPGWAQAIGNVLPLTYFNRLVRAIFLKGTPGWDLWPNVWPLMLFTAVVMAIAVKFYRKTLD